MKKFIIYVIFVFVVGFSSYFIYGSMQAAKHDGTAIPYIQEVLPKLSTWNLETVKQYMVPEVLQTVSDEKLGHLLKSLSKIGELKSIGDVTFKDKTTDDKGRLVKGLVVTYDIEAQYSTGAAIVTLGLLDNGGTYQIYYFNFQSKALAQQ